MSGLFVDRADPELLFVSGIESVSEHAGSAFGVARLPW